jgi:uncharacterized protein (DUF2236 family)
VRKIHASLTGTDADGTVFRLGEPEQLLWVHCAGVDSYVNICRRCGMDATPAQRDAFVAEQGRSAALVGLDPAEAPASVVELNAYYAYTRRRARASAEAKESLLMSFARRSPRAHTTKAGRPRREHSGVRGAPALGPEAMRGTGNRADRCRHHCGPQRALPGHASRPGPAPYTATVCNPGR